MKENVVVRALVGLVCVVVSVSMMAQFNLKKAVSGAAKML